MNLSLSTESLLKKVKYNGLKFAEYDKIKRVSLIFIIAMSMDPENPVNKQWE